MNKCTQETRTLARRLIIHEAHQKSSEVAGSPRPFPVSEKLHPYLSTLMGPGGYRALLSRALALASAEVSWLRTLEVRPDGSLEDLTKAHKKLDPDHFLEGRIVLLAHLLGLLRAFIGELLTLRLLREVWPTIPLNDLDFGSGGKYEKKQ